MKYKVGDKVRINPSCKEGHEYDGLTLLSSMKFEGVSTIRKIEGRAIWVDENGFIYRPAMFELAEEEPKKVRNLKVGDKVLVRKDLCTNKKYYMHDKSGWDIAIDDMVKLAGKIVTIKEVYGSWYNIEEECCNWVDEMFEPIEELKEVTDYVLFDMSPIPVIPSKPIVVIPVVSDSFTKSWMESFVKRNGGMAVSE